MPGSTRARCRSDDAQRWPWRCCGGRGRPSGSTRSICGRCWTAPTPSSTASRPASARCSRRAGTRAGLLTVLDLVAYLEEQRALPAPTVGHAVAADERQLRRRDVERLRRAGRRGVPTRCIRDRLRASFQEAPPARRTAERPPARRPPDRRRTLPARPLAASDRHHPRRARENRRRLRGPEGEPPSPREPLRIAPSSAVLTDGPPIVRMGVSTN